MYSLKTHAVRLQNMQIDHSVSERVRFNIPSDTV